MGLADYQPLREEITFVRGGGISVRGFSLEDVALLMNTHFPDINKLFDMYQQQVEQAVVMDAMVQFAATLVREAPMLVANMIALAADEPGAVDKARMLPIAAQIECLKKIAKLTFEEAGGVKNFFESLKMLLGGMVPARLTDSNT